MIEITRKQYGEYYANFVAKNGQILATTNTFHAKSKLLKALESIKEQFGNDMKIVDNSANSPYKKFKRLPR